MDLLLFIGGLGGGEIAVILAIILIFFGPKKIPEIARSFGRGIREFKKASEEIRNELEEGLKH
jgi:sec-independent protein translocase protein TatA